MSYVSADRKREGLALDLPVGVNAVAGPGLTGLARRGWLGRRRPRAAAQAVLDRAEVRYGSAADPVSGLSGGNQQRVVIGRETTGDVRVLVASQPTRGVDVRGIRAVHALLRRARDEGAAIVLFSEELDELRALSDRILVLHRGAVAGELPGDADRAAVGDLMLGHRTEAAS
jgi:simple sugar transport system ATP-binding protein